MSMNADKIETRVPSIPVARVYSDRYLKLWRSEGYNFTFDKESGFFVRWGKSQEDDPPFSPYGPEILDLEISTGDCLGHCRWCYKCNGQGIQGEHMSLKEFKTILHKMPATLTQIAFGITNIGANKEFFAMMEHARKKGIIPNYTCHGLDMTQEFADKSADLCGAVSVSIVKRDKSYDAIQTLTEAGVRQVNIHYVLAEESFEMAFGVLDDISRDPRLMSLNAIVFLQYKPKGRNAYSFHPLKNVNCYRQLMSYCDDRKIKYGFDSCSAPMFFRAIEHHPKEQELITLVEPCESSLFSSYINVKGHWYPCSFCEGSGDWKEGINVLKCNDFLEDVWYSDRVKEFRQKLLASSASCKCSSYQFCRSCPIYPVTPCREKVNE